MAAIVVVHGIGQQYRGASILHNEFWLALQSGVSVAGGELTDPTSLVCPFYAHLFRGPESMGIGDSPASEKSSDLEVALLDALWREAAAIEPHEVPSREQFDSGEALVSTPQFVQQALNALSRSRFWAHIAQGVMLGNLRQVTAYLTDPTLGSSILKIVQDSITEDTRVVIGHSLGSVIAYEALCAAPNKVVSFVTVGSPLGIRNVIFDRLTPRPSAAGTGVWPNGVRFWTNIADRGDIVALQKRLAPLFGTQIKDVLVDNGADAHKGERYLTTRVAGETVLAGLHG